MANYKKQSPRLTVKFIDPKTNELLITINDRSWMDVGEIFSNNYTSSIITDELKNKALPKKIIVMVFGEFELEKD